MTKKEKKEYLEQLVANQGNQAGISIAPLLSAIIADCEDVFTVTVEDNQENTKNVTNPQAEIDAFIDAVNADPLHNIPKVYISGVVISFEQLEINDDRHLVCGDISAINKQPNTLLLSQSAAKRIYGGENPVGKKVIGQDQKAYTIGGVFENFPANNSISPYEPIEALTLSVLDGFLEQQIEERTGCNTYALTLPNFKPDDLDKQLRNLNLRILLFDKNPSLVRAFQLGHTKYKTH